ncbi:kinesin-like protein KIF19 [Notamacropus eugenii]|uniref:kinesin-like protein KIF19 n=1 Tax=Notamacropus eugenii TaxID=9315 RepID=UPI003B670DF3
MNKSSCWPPQAAWEEMIYEATTKNLIEGIISGYNATVFAYGPTGELTVSPLISLVLSRTQRASLVCPPDPPTWKLVNSHKQEVYRTTPLHYPRNDLAKCCGKTYTMLGTDKDPGIYIWTLNDLFCAIEETNNDVEYEVSMSYLEIYNEMIRDLLNPSMRYLELREDSKRVIQVAGIIEVSTTNAKEIMQLLIQGNKQRYEEPTAANQASSRSHTIL